MMTLLRTTYKVRTGYTVCYAENLMPRQSKPSREQRIYVKQERKNITYSADARKRFVEALDNFACLFKSADKYNESLLFHTHGGKIHKRRPVFVTLTVPAQCTSDMDIKRKALSNIIQNLTKHYGLKAYCWKAEAQERGTIHFHLVIDCFIFESRLRKLWYNNLNRLGCIPKGFKVTKASRLVHFKLIKNLDTISAELSSYFEGERDENGRLIHKHDKDKRVRDITGRSWGCADCLKYQAFTIYEATGDVTKEIEDTAIKTIEIHSDKGTKIAEVYISQYGKREPHYLGKMMTIYHYDHACRIYSKDKIKRRVIFKHEESGKFRLHETGKMQLRTEEEEKAPEIAAEVKPKNEPQQLKLSLAR